MNTKFADSQLVFIPRDFGEGYVDQGYGHGAISFHPIIIFEAISPGGVFIWVSPDGPLKPTIGSIHHLEIDWARYGGWDQGLPYVYEVLLVSNDGKKSRYREAFPTRKRILDKDEASMLDGYLQEILGYGPALLKEFPTVADRKEETTLRWRDFMVLSARVLLESAP